MNNFYEEVSRDFPDGFLASFDTPNRETRPVLHVIDIDVDPKSPQERPLISLTLAQELPGKVFEFEILSYEVIENDPKMVRVTMQGYQDAMIWSDNLSDELRGQMRAARAGGRLLTDEEDPPLSTRPRPETPDETPSEPVIVTEEQAEDPEIGARVLIGDLLESEETE